jgi:hypothetical protein
LGARLGGLELVIRHLVYHRCLILFARCAGYKPNSVAIASRTAGLGMPPGEVFN